MKKVTIFIYGALAYLIFLASFLYAIGFVGNLLVPKSIDSGTETSLIPSLLINLLLLSVFAIQHSVMARPAFKRWFTGIFSAAMERSTYVLLSSLALVLIYWQWRPINIVVWSAETDLLVYALYGLFFLGWLIVLLSTFMINHFELFGLKQIFDNLKNRTAAHSTFQTNYLYKIVRHPIMLGFLIAFWATPVMSLGHLLFSGVTTLYILVAVTYLEERDLRKALGTAYANYQQEVPMLIPFTKPKEKASMKRINKY